MSSGRPIRQYQQHEPQYCVHWTKEEVNYYYAVLLCACN